MSAAKVQSAEPALWAGPVEPVLCEEHLPAEVQAHIARRCRGTDFVIVGGAEWFLQNAVDRRIYASLHNKRMACGTCGAR